MSTQNDREPRLPPRAEEMLDGWPAPSRGALAWEETASGIMARVRDTAIASTPDELLDAPLPEEPGEGSRGAPQGSAPASSMAPGADEPSLAEIARAAMASSEAANREIARDAMIAAEAGRRSPPREAPPPRAAAVSAKVAGLQGRVARVSEPGRAAAKAAPLVAVPAEPAVAPAHEAPAHSELPGPPSREAGRWNAAVFGGAVLAIAAAATLYVSSGRHTAPEAQLSASPEARHAAPAAAKPGAPAVTPPEPVTTTEAAASTPERAQRLAFDELPVAAKSRPAASSGRDSLAFRVKKESPKGGEKQLVLEERDEAPQQNAPQAVAAHDTPAQATPLAERPSGGAVQAALGSVMTGARSCLAGQEEGTRATVTFEGKTGRVKSVTLAGAAAGSPAESCVRGALMGARLPAFSEDTFTASVTVRPL